MNNLDNKKKVVVIGEISEFALFIKSFIGADYDIALVSKDPVSETLASKSEVFYHDVLSNTFSPDSLSLDLKSNGFQEVDVLLHIVDGVNASNKFTKYLADNIQRYSEFGIIGKNTKVVFAYKSTDYRTNIKLSLFDFQLRTNLHENSNLISSNLIFLKYELNGEGNKNLDDVLSLLINTSMENNRYYSYSKDELNSITSDEEGDLSAKLVKSYKESTNTITKVSMFSQINS